MLDLIRETALLREDLARLPKPAGIAAVYHPIRYAWAAHRRYLERYVNWRRTVDGRDEEDGMQRRRIVLVGMNPGPRGMTQTGVPFGDVPNARRILGEPAMVGVEDFVFSPADTLLEKRPVQGFACTKTEVSGERLWGGLASLWGSLDAVLANVFALNYCPLVYFDEESAANVTPGDLKDRAYKTKLNSLCDPYLLAVVAAMRPEVVVTVGTWTDGRVQAALANTPGRPRVVKILHPSPASPLANANGGTGWLTSVTATLQEAELLPR